MKKIYYVIIFCFLPAMAAKDSMIQSLQKLESSLKKLQKIINTQSPLVDLKPAKPSAPITPLEPVKPKQDKPLQPLEPVKPITPLEPVKQKPMTPLEPVTPKQESPMQDLQPVVPKQKKFVKGPDPKETINELKNEIISDLKDNNDILLSILVPIITEEGQLRAAYERFKTNFNNFLNDIEKGLIKNESKDFDLLHNFYLLNKYRIQTMLAGLEKLTTLPKTDWAQGSKSYKAIDTVLSQIKNLLKTMSTEIASIVQANQAILVKTIFVDELEGGTVNAAREISKMVDQIEVQTQVQQCNEKKNSIACVINDIEKKFKS